MVVTEFGKIYRNLTGTGGSYSLGPSIIPLRQLSVTLKTTEKCQKFPENN
jgi:hypothetical protein